MTSLSESAQAELDRYAHYLSTHEDLSQASYRNYIGDLRLFIQWFEEDQSEVFQFDRVTTPTLTRYRDYLQKQKQLKPATINRYLISLKRYFGWTTHKPGPADPVKLVAEVKPVRRNLSNTEEAHLIAALNREGKQRDITLITLMLHTGLRVGEACRLKWADITLGERTGKLKIWGKRNKYREVPLNATARRALQTYQDSLDGDLPSEYVFTSQRTGSHLTTRGVRFILDKYAQHAGIDDISPHDLRHRFGYRMAEDVPLHRLAQIMGHDSLDTTMIYIEGTPQDLQQAVESIAWE